MKFWKDTKMTFPLGQRLLYRFIAGSFNLYTRVKKHIMRITMVILSLKRYAELQIIFIKMDIMNCRDYMCLP